MEPIYGSFLTEDLFEGSDSDHRNTTKSYIHAVYTYTSATTYPILRFSLVHLASYFDKKLSSKMTLKTN